MLFCGGIPKAIQFHGHPCRQIIMYLSGLVYPKFSLEQRSGDSGWVGSAIAAFTGNDAVLALVAWPGPASRSARTTESGTTQT